jgi:hypothetical protein
MRGAQNSKPSTYTCPFCGKRLASMSQHVLIAPEDDKSKRRHAHMRRSIGDRLRGLFAGKGSGT